MAVEYIWVQGEAGATMMAKQPQYDPKGLFGEEGFTFKDALDIINPLQQLPIIGSIYRELTGDTIKPGARLIGGGIYGLGIVGLVGAALNNAVEYDTGHDIAGTALALVRGESLKDMQVAAAAKRGESATQLASTQYFAGGADPIDPTSLPPGAKLVDAPAGPAAAPSKQYAALTTDQPSADAGATPAAAPSTAVSVAPLPPTINPTGAPTGAPGANLGASDGAGVPALPAPAGLTGMSARSHLPTAGSITPASAALTAAAATESLQAGATGAASAAAINPTAISPVATVAAATAASASPTIAKSADVKSADGYVPVPARTNNVTPRMPIALNQANVGTQPLALSNTDRRTMAPLTVSAAPSADATAAANPTLAPTQVPEAMMRALDKYDALMRSRRNGSQVDRNL